MRTHFLILLGFICCLGLHAQDVQPVGSATCMECHDEIGDHFLKGAHQHPMFLGEGGRGCEACHGNGSEHMESSEPADIQGSAVLSEWSDAQKSKACLSCHQENIHGWSSSPHATEASCWDCHGEMLHFQPEEKQKLASCAECHRDVAMRGKLQYRHPIACASCHDPHAENDQVEDSTNKCLSCHSNHQGPFVYEHGALDDGCQVCHEPHGSHTQRMLKMTGNGLCLQCHTQSSFPAVGKKVHSSLLTGGAFCYDCHSEVHGSNTDPNLIRRLR